MMYRSVLVERKWTNEGGRPHIESNASEGAGMTNFPTHHNLLDSLGYFVSVFIDLKYILL